MKDQLPQDPIEIAFSYLRNLTQSFRNPLERDYQSIVVKDSEENSILCFLTLPEEEIVFGCRVVMRTRKTLKYSDIVGAINDPQLSDENKTALRSHFPIIRQIFKTGRGCLATWDSRSGVKTLHIAMCNIANRNN